MQHFLKAAAGATRTQVIPAKLLEQFLVAVHHSSAAPYVRL